MGERNSSDVTCNKIKLSELFELEESEKSKLGEGSFGVVYKGKNRKSNRAVAVKRVAPNGLKEDELTVIRQLNNPFIVGYLEVVNFNDSCYIVMELMDQDLGKFIDKHDKLTAVNVDTVAKHIAQGYLALHEKTIVHRDLKPHNILLKLGSTVVNTACSSDQSDGQTRERVLSISSITRKLSRTQANQDLQPRIFCAKISDFGTSRQTISMETSNLAGTLCYMAPEVGANLIGRTEYGPAVDMWSIGVVLFEAVSGKVPFSENALCKLFLYATGQNYLGFEQPKLKDGGVKYKVLITRLLEIDPLKRLKPRAFHDYLVYDHDLPPKPLDDDAVSNISRFSRRSRFSSSQKSNSNFERQSSRRSARTGSRVSESERSQRTASRSQKGSVCLADLHPVPEHPRPLLSATRVKVPKFLNLLCCCCSRCKEDQEGAKENENDL